MTVRAAGEVAVTSAERVGASRNWLLVLGAGFDLLLNKAGELVVRAWSRRLAAERAAGAAAGDAVGADSVGAARVDEAGRELIEADWTTIFVVERMRLKIHF